MAIRQTLVQSGAAGPRPQPRPKQRALNKFVRPSHLPFIFLKTLFTLAFMGRFLILMAFLFPAGLLAKPYDSKSLQTKDYEEMRDILSEYIKSSQAPLSGEEERGEDVESAVFELKKGLKTLLMRPDADSISSSLIPLLQNEIIKYRAFMTVFREVTKEAIEEFKAQKGPIAYQASLLYLIENALSYLQSINNKESSEILKSVKSAKLKTSDKIFNYLLLEMGRGKSASPSYLAGKILKQRAKEKKLAEKRKMEKKLAEEKAKRQKREPSGEKPPLPANQESGADKQPIVSVDLQPSSGSPASNQK